MNTKLATLAFGIVCLCVGNAVCRAQQPDDEGMKKWMEYMTPGQSHQLLAGRVGKWKLSIKMWMEIGQPPSEMESNSELKMIMDGRYLVESVKGDFQGTPFEGQNTTAYDNGSQKFISTWIDNMGTGVIIGEGTYSPDKKEFHYATRFTDPMTHKPSQGRSVDKMVDENTWIMQSYKKSPAGKEYMDMEITYRRVTQ